jgi:hypothetical protein
MGGACSTSGSLVGTPEGRRPLGRPRRRWVDNIKMDLGEVGWGDVACEWWLNTVVVRESSALLLRQALRLHAATP